MASTRFGRSYVAGLAALVLLVVLAGDFAPGALAQGISLRVDNRARNGAVHLKITAASLPKPFEIDVSGGQTTSDLIENVPVLPSAKFEFRLSGDDAPGAGVYSISPDVISGMPVLFQLDVAILGECEDSNQPGLEIRVFTAPIRGVFTFCASPRPSANSKGPWDVLGSGIAG